MTIIGVKQKVTPKNLSLIIISQKKKKLSREVIAVKKANLR